MSEPIKLPMVRGVKTGGRKESTSKRIDAAIRRSIDGHRELLAALADGTKTAKQTKVLAGK